MLPFLGHGRYITLLIDDIPRDGIIIKYHDHILSVRFSGKKFTNHTSQVQC